MTGNNPTRVAIRLALAAEGQTDAVARCCTGKYFRHSEETWFASAPYSVMMPEHHISCMTCGQALTYEERAHVQEGFIYG